MDVKLVIVSGGKQPRTLEFHTDEIVVGRLRSCPLCIPSAEVSRQHCRLAMQDGYFTVEDLGSSNGTYLNGTKIKELMVVRPGDLLEVGPVKFKVEYELSAEAQALLDGAADVNAEEQPVATAEGSPFDFSLYGEEGAAAGGEEPAAEHDPAAEHGHTVEAGEAGEVGEDGSAFATAYENPEHAQDVESHGLEFNPDVDVGTDTAIVNPESPPDAGAEPADHPDPIQFLPETEEHVEAGENFTLELEEPPPPPPAKKSRTSR